jgi:hypothetical protein
LVTSGANLISPEISPDFSERFSEIFESFAIGEQLPQKPPSKFCGVVKRGGRFASKEINSRKEVVRTSATLKARDQLHQDPASSISDVRLFPILLPGVLLTLIEHQGLQHKHRHWVPLKVKMPVPDGLEDGEDLLPGADVLTTSFLLLISLEANRPPRLTTLQNLLGGF